MPRKLITVTEEHIRKGKRWMQYECPIALAIEDESLTDCTPEVTRKHINLGDGPIHISRSVKRFIRDFDAGKKVEPFKFYLTY